MKLSRCPQWWALCFHGLALVPAPEPANLFDARYVAWCRASLPEEAWRPFDDDRDALSALIARAGSEATALQLMPLVHRDVAGFLADAGRSIAEVASARVANAYAHEALCALARRHEALVELLRADLALAAKGFCAVDARDADEPPCDAALSRALDRAARVIPSLQRREVRVARALGSRGRGLGGVVVAGCVGGWSGLDAERIVALVLHEHAVLLAAEACGREASYARVERLGLTAMERALAESDLEAAYSAWRETIDVTRVFAERSNEAEGEVLATLIARLREA